MIDSDLVASNAKGYNRRDGFGCFDEFSLKFFFSRSDFLFGDKKSWAPQSLPPSQAVNELGFADLLPYLGTDEVC